MKRRAPHCYRWVERMNVGDSGMAEFPDRAETFLPSDEIPETTIAILQLMAQDYMPELLSIVESVDDWLQSHPEIKPGSPVPASTGGMGTINPLGTHKVTLRGVEIELAVQHYSLWMLGRVQNHYDQLGSDEQQQADQVLAATGLSPLIGARTSLRIERQKFQEVFV